MPGRSFGGARRLPAFLSVATAAQVAFWILATPGPSLLAGAPRGPGTAFAAVAWTAATLGVAALVAGPLLGRSAGPGLAPGRTARGLPAVLLVTTAAAPVLWLAAQDPSLAATYPWPSAAWLRDDPRNWLPWIAAYAVYYLAFEAFYRGALLGALAPRLGTGTANVLQASFATMVHVGKPVVEVAAAFPASVAFGFLVLRYRSLWPAIVLHLAIGLLTDGAVTLRGSP